MIQRSTIWTALIGVIAFALPVRGQNPPTRPPAIEPKADELLRRTSAVLSGATQYTFEAHDLIDEILPSGQKVQFASTRHYSVHRPNRVRLVIDGDLVQDRIWYNGKTLTILNTEENTYGSIEVPGTIDELFDFIVERYGIVVPLADLLFSDMYGVTVGGIRAGHYLGLHRVGDDLCHHLTFRQDAVDWQLWIQDGDQPVPRKLVITYKAMPGQPQYTALFDHWNLRADLADGLFQFEAPAGAKEIDFEPMVTDPRSGRGSSPNP